jgi:isopenicillin N synthase-like dioxygenase
LDDPIPVTLDAEDPAAFAARLGGDFERYGFASVRDHGIPEALIERANADIKAFFALPDPVKRRYHQPGGGGQRGLTPFGIETAKGAAKSDLKEFWHTGRELPAGHRLQRFMPPNVWPTEIPTFQANIYALFEALDGLGLTLLRAIARHLGLASNHFDSSVELGNSILRALHYPPVEGPSDHVRAGAHEDINVITLLLGAEEAGLELKDRDGTWLAVNPPPGAVVVNIGDMLQRLTNHVLPSTTHRVVNPSPERARFARYSTPFFLHFRPDYLIETLPNCVTAERPNRYPLPITADGYLQERLAEIKLK